MMAFTRAAIPETELQIAFKEHQICVLVGRAPGTISRGAALVDTPAPPQIPLGVPAQLLERRPDVLAAEQGVIGAGKRVGVAVADRLPTLSLSGFIGLQAVSLIEQSAGEEAGIKSATLQIKGENAYGWLKTESGVHRQLQATGRATYCARTAVITVLSIPRDVDASGFR